MHSTPSPGKDYARIISYTNVLQQALRDLSAWGGVRRASAPDQQLSSTARWRCRRPPPSAAVVTTTANGGTRAEVKVGRKVTFAGTVEVPPGTGKVVSAQWDFDGVGSYKVTGKFKLTDATGERATTISHAFAKPGTYFPALRVASQRSPDGTAYARIENLARVRVVVR